MSAPGAKRALLIGSPVHGLRGTENDLNTMTTILKSRGFETESAVYVNRLFHRDATRQKILDAWEALIRDASWGDTVVIYYSGHGVCVESDVANEASTQPSKIQFIVPYDFDCTLQQWKGISDGELSLLLRRITAKTRNVTYILDCCHSARLGRKYGEVHFEPKAFGLSKSLYTGLATILERLRQEGRFTEDRLDTNPYAVRISAAGTDETAWEYHKDGHSYMGLLTRSLSKAIMKSNDNRSWRDIMLEVAVLVEQDYPEGNQHPRSAGPDNRRPFSLDTTATGALLATIWDDEYTMLRGGRVHGIQKGDVFTITPFGSHNRSGGKATEGTVILVNAFAAVISPTPKPSEYGFAMDRVMGHAVLQKRQSQLPVMLPADSPILPRINALMDQFVFLKTCAAHERPLLKIRHEQDRIILQDSRGLQLHTERLINGVSLNGVLRRLLERAKEYVQAQNILSLRSGIYDEAFGDNVDIEVGIQNGGAKNVLTRRSQSLPGATIERAAFALKENDRLYISMKNTSTNKVFVNALSVDAAGKTTLVSKAWERGIGLTPGRSHTLALRTFPLLGIPIRWPTSVPRSGYVEESLVFVITNEEVDLRNLDASLKGYVRRGPDDAAARDSGIIQYHVEHVRYHLRPSSSS